MLFRKTVHLVTAASIAASSFANAPAWSQTPNRSVGPSAVQPQALSGCSVSAIAASVGSTVTISAVEVVAGQICRVQGTVATSGDDAPDGSARFELNLPANWNRKFLFVGGGGFDGTVPKAPEIELAKGYATLATDSGHVQDPRYPSDGLDASWAINSDGTRAAAKIADYAYRARHQVNAMIRPVVGKFYGAEVERAYFMGCSGGGREALIEAQRHPEDYDGFIAGDPTARTDTSFTGARNFRALLAAPIPFAKLPVIDQAVLAECDARDGVKDGLIQNPAMCAFDPRTLVPSGALTKDQAHALQSYLTAPRDDRGRQVGFAGSVSGIGDLSGAFPGMTGGLTGLTTYLSDGMPPAASPWPWGALPAGTVNWVLYNGVISALGLGKPGMSILDPAISSADGILSARMVDTVTANVKSALVDPKEIGRFFASGRKLLIYHGFDDTILDPYSTIATYQEITQTGGGLAKAQATARLFMVPGMGHCFAGSGPNVFDALSAMENWAEKDDAPDAIIAYKFKDNMPGPDKPIERSMPLCPFPQMARYDGKGDVNVAASWSCAAGDNRLTDNGPNGKAAGIGATFAAFR